MEVMIGQQLPGACRAVAFDLYHSVVATEVKGQGQIYKCDHLLKWQ
jgi:hypothetical protein